MFHYRISIATDHFSDHKLLGCGIYGLVYKALLTSGRLVAVKNPSLRRAPSSSPSSEFDNELLILSHFRNECQIVLIFERFPGLATLNGGPPLELNTESLVSHAMSGALLVSQELVVFLFAAHVANFRLYSTYVKWVDASTDLIEFGKADLKMNFTEFLAHFPAHKVFVKMLRQQMAACGSCKSWKGNITTLCSLRAARAGKAK